MQTIGVNIVPGNFPQFVRYSQGDIGREFKINVVDFDIPSGATVECVATKPSGLGFTVSGTVTDNTVSFITTAIMTDEWGKFPAELRISSGGEVLGTANFMFIGERNPHPEGTTDGQQGTIIPEVTLLVNEIRESNARVAEMTASAHTSDVPTAEYDAETNNLEFGIPSIPEEEFLKAFVTDSASGSIASFTDGADDVPCKSVKVNISPVQDLHGQSYPYPEGGSANKWDEVWELGGINVSNGQNVTDSTTIRSKNYIPVTPNAVYYLYCGTQATFNYRLYDSNKEYVSGAYLGRNNTLTIPSNASYMRFVMGSSYGTTYKNDISINYPSTDTSYHPYSNICPISGWDTVHLTVSSGNLFGGEVDEMFPLFIPQGTTVSAYSDTETKVYYYDQNGTDIDYWSVGGGYTRTFNIIADAYYFKFETNGGATPTKLAIEYGDVSIASNYKPFTGLDQKSISLGQTVYGGTLDVTNGVLTIDRAKIVLDGTQDIALPNWRPQTNSVGWIYGGSIADFKVEGNWEDVPTKFVSDKLKADSYYHLFENDTQGIGIYTSDIYSFVVRVNDTSLTTVDAINSYLSANPITVVYELANPTTIQLTPTEIKTLLGNNNIYSDAGTVEVEYRADTKKYVDKKIAETQAMILENIGG